MKSDEIRWKWLLGTGFLLCGQAKIQRSYSNDLRENGLNDFPITHFIFLICHIQYVKKLLKAKNQFPSGFYICYCLEIIPNTTTDWNSYKQNANVCLKVTETSTAEFPFPLGGSACSVSLSSLHCSTNCQVIHQLVVLCVWERIQPSKHEFWYSWNQSKQYLRVGEFDSKQGGYRVKKKKEKKKTELTFLRLGRACWPSLLQSLGVWKTTREPAKQTWWGHWIQHKR